MKLLRFIQYFFYILLIVTQLSCSTQLSNYRKIASLSYNENLWNSIVLDVFNKSHEYPEMKKYCPVILECFNRVRAIPWDKRESLSFSEIYKELQFSGPEAMDLVEWLGSKYGVNDEAVINLVSISIQPGTNESRLKPPRLPDQFDPKGDFSIGEIDQYLDRKWVGIKEMLDPSEVIISELTREETLDQLTAMNYDSVRKVNAAYLSRGLDTYLAINTKTGERSFVFSNFIGKDLYGHYAMQLAVMFQDEFEKVRSFVSQDGKSSWDHFSKKLNRDISRHLPDKYIDDLVIGYNDFVESVALKNAKFVNEIQLGEFLSVKKYIFTDLLGIERSIGVLHTAPSFRYFGEVITYLLRPFLDKGTNRIIFAGSAGSLKTHTAVNDIVTPRSFSLFNEEGTLKRIPVKNDLYDFSKDIPHHTGRHVSLESPLVETVQLVEEMRDNNGVLTVDVEGAHIANMIEEYNTRTNGDKRLASLFIVTDHPGEKGGAGLHTPRVAGKKESKILFAKYLERLWHASDEETISGHARLVTEHYLRLIRKAQRNASATEMNHLYQQLKAKSKMLHHYADTNLRVSRGLSQRIGDLMRVIEKDRLFNPNRVADLERVPRVTLSHVPTHNKINRILQLQSLSRSSTLSSGDVVKNTGQSFIANRQTAIATLDHAFDFIESKKDSHLSFEDLRRLHTILADKILEPNQYGTIGSFEYISVDGEKTPAWKAVVDFLEWYNSAPKTPENALEAFFRFEHIHPFLDGNGRVAEFLTHLMNHQGGNLPAVIPNRFDIDYIMALRRNGPTPQDEKAFADLVYSRSNRFARWLEQNLPVEKIVDSYLDSNTGKITIDLSNGKRLRLETAFLSDNITLEREQRTLLRTYRELGRHLENLQQNHSSRLATTNESANGYKMIMNLVEDTSIESKTLTNGADKYYRMSFKVVEGKIQFFGNSIPITQLRNARVIYSDVNWKTGPKEAPLMIAMDKSSVTMTLPLSEKPDHHLKMVLRGGDGNTYWKNVDTDIVVNLSKPQPITSSCVSALSVFL